MTSYPVEHEVRCEDIRSIVEEYLAGELDMKIHTAVENHLVVCPHCQDEIDIALGLEEVLQALPKPELPPEIFDHVAAYVRSHPRHRLTGWVDGLREILGASHFRPLPTMVASICLICLVLFGVYRQHQHTLQIEKASRELSYALSTVQYAMQKTGLAIDEHFPADQVLDTPLRALIHTTRQINATTSDNLSQAIRRSSVIFNKFGQNAISLK